MTGKSFDPKTNNIFVDEAQTSLGEAEELGLEGNLLGRGVRLRELLMRR